MFVGNAAIRRLHCTLCNPKEHSRNPHLCRNLFRIYYWGAEKDFSPALALTAFVFARSLKLINIHTYIRTYIYTYIHAYVHIFTHSFFHSFIHTYIHTYMHTHTHTHTHTHPFWRDRVEYRIVSYMFYLFIVLIYINTVNTDF